MSLSSIAFPSLSLASALALVALRPSPDAPAALDRGVDIFGAVVAYAGTTYTADLYGTPPLDWEWDISGAQGAASGTFSSSPASLQIAVPSSAGGETLTISLSAANGDEQRLVQIVP